MKQNPFKKTFHLRQHTPLIHFQPHQAGATLRATEVKPKLDRFIIERKTKAKGDTATEKMLENHPEWLVGGGVPGHAALDYKLNIRANIKEKYVIGSSISKHARRSLEQQGIKYLTSAPYFADNEPIKKGRLNDIKWGVMMDNIRIEVFSLNAVLLQTIERELPFFFAYNNFGTRQSKGFGCFTLEDTNINDFEDMLAGHPRYKDAMYYQFKRRGSLTEIFKKLIMNIKFSKVGLPKSLLNLWNILKIRTLNGKNRPSKRNLSKEGENLVERTTPITKG